MAVNNSGRRIESPSYAPPSIKYKDDFSPALSGVPDSSAGRSRPIVPTAPIDPYIFQDEGQLTAANVEPQSAVQNAHDIVFEGDEFISPALQEAKAVYNKAETEYNAAQEALQNTLQNAPADIDFDSDINIQNARAAAKTAETNLRIAREAYEKAGGMGHSYSFEDRASDTVKGALGSSGASFMDAFRALWEKGSAGRGEQDRENYAKLDLAAGTAQTKYFRALQAANGNEEDPAVVEAKRRYDEARAFADRYRGISEKDQGLSARAQDLADRTAATSAQNISRAKEGLGETGQFLVDLGVSGTQLAADAAISAMTGIPATALVGMRSFGGGTMQARQGGGDIDQQLAYGAATATVEMLTEKMADGVAGVFGKGAADDVAESVIRKLAQTDAGRTALRTIYGMAGEGAEEFVSSAVDPALRAIYNGQSVKQNYSEEDIADWFYDALVGAALGLPGSAGAIVTGQNAAKNTELRMQDASLGDVGSQVGNALDVLQGRISPEQQAAREANARRELGLERPASTGIPALDVIQTGQVQSEVPAPMQTAPATAPTASAAPATAPASTGIPVLDVIQNGQVQSEAAAPAVVTAAPAAIESEAPAASLDDQLADVQKRLAEINAELDSLEGLDDSQVDDAHISELVEEGQKLWEQERNLSGQIEARNTQQARVDAGEVSKAYGTPENHIDNRNFSDVANQSTKAFQFDHPELHEHFVNAAQELMREVEAADMQTLAKAGQKGSAVKRGPVRYLMDNGMSKPRIMKCLTDIINNNGAENYADAKRVELVLNDMMTNGWTGLDRSAHNPNPDYIAAKDAIDGGIKADSWAAFLERNSLSLALGEVTEEQLRAEWEAQHPEAAQPAQPEQPAPGNPTAAPTAQSEPVVNAENTESAPPPGNGPTLPPSDTTTAESTNGSGPERERGGSANIRTNENAEADLRQSFEADPSMYRQLTNAEVQQKADAIIAKGFDAARSEVEQAIGEAKSGKKLSPEHLVAGFEVANELTRRGDVEAANRLMADIFAEQTAAGQLGQLGRLLRQNSPAVKSMTVQNIVEKMNGALTEGQRNKNRRMGRGDAEGNIQVDPALVEQFANATDDAVADAALDAIMDDVASQVPATFVDKFTALRYLNMLGNIKTQGRNIVGNTAMMLATDIKRTVQAVNELAVSAATGGKYERNTSLFTSKELRQQARADFEQNVDYIKGESKFSDTGKKALQGIQDRRTIFGSGESSKWASSLLGGILGKDVDVKKNVLENARNLTNWAMDAGDVIFMKHTYVQAFAGWMKAHGINDVSTATAEQLASAREFAAKEAQEATFHDNNKVSNFVSGIARGENTPAIVSSLAEGILPFRKTPANVAVRAIEYSPVGIAETIYKGVQAAKGQGSAADVINSLSKNATGTALAIAGYFLAAAGMARGSGDDEDDDLNYFQKMQGASDYSVKIGDSYVSLSQFAPMAIPFFMGVKLNELLENADEPLSMDNVGDILGVISDPMLEMSMLSGVNDTLSNIASLNGDTDAIPSLVANAAIGYLSQGLSNTLIGQLEQAGETNRQTVYSDTKSTDASAFDQILGTKGQKQLGKFAAKIPGWDYNQQDYVDAWGRTQDTGGPIRSAFNALLNPTYVTDNRSTEVDAELERLHTENRDVEGFPNVLPEKRGRYEPIGDGIVLTPDEYLQFSKDSGQMKLGLVSDFMQSEQYQNLDDQQRAEIISNLYQFADDRALSRVKGEYGIEKQSDYDKLLAGQYEANGDEKRPPLQEQNVGEYIAFDTMFKAAKKDEDYDALGALFNNFEGLDENTQAVLAAKDSDGIVRLITGVDKPNTQYDIPALSPDSLPEYLRTKEVLTSTDYEQIDSVLDNWQDLSPDTQAVLKKKIGGLKGVRFAHDNFNMSAATYNRVKTLVGDHEAEDLEGKDHAVADAAVISKYFKGTDAQKLMALESQNLPDGQSGKRNSTVRHFEAAMSAGYDYDTWAKIEAYVRDNAKYPGSPTNAVLDAAGRKFGLPRGEVARIWRKDSANEKKISVFNDYFSYSYVAPNTPDISEYLAGDPHADRGRRLEELTGLTG